MSFLTDVSTTFDLLLNKINQFDIKQSLQSISHRQADANADKQDRNCARHMQNQEANEKLLKSCHGAIGCLA